MARYLTPASGRGARVTRVTCHRHMTESLVVRSPSRVSAGFQLASDIVSCTVGRALAAVRPSSRY